MSSDGFDLAWSAGLRPGVIRRTRPQTPNAGVPRLESPRPCPIDEKRIDGTATTRFQSSGMEKLSERVRVLVSAGW
jgi:hypothetical protein